MSITNLIPWKREKKVPVQRESAQPIDVFQHDMNRLFDEFFGRSFGLAPEWFGESAGSFNPSVDIVETDKDIQVSAELPGMTEKDIEVTLSGDVLTISGEKKEEREEKDKNYHRIERSYGAFHRSVTLPAEVNGDKVAASFNKGVLTITLPKVETGKTAKKITIKAQ